MRVVLIVVLLVVAACGAEEPSPAPVTTTSPVVDDDIGTAMGAVDTLLASCIPGVGETRCTWASLSGAITELTGEIRAAGAHSELTTAVDGMDEAVATFTPCAGWFDSDTTTGDQLACDAAWYDLTGAWTALKKAADWP